MTSKGPHAETVCVIGLGYVGLTLAVALGNAGFAIRGVERNPEILRSLKAGHAHFMEVGLNEHLSPQLASGQFRFGEKLAPELAGDIYVITVGTPTDENNRVMETSIVEVTEDLAKVMRGGEMVILRSTVTIGASRRLVKVVLDRVALPYDLAFCPERTLEGKALHELTHLPQIVGGFTPQATERAAAFFGRLTTETVKVSSPEAAELAKLMNNCERDLKFALANEMAAICDVLGLSAKEIVHAANHKYPRSHLAVPGPVGGPCLEKDTFILAEGLRGTAKSPDILLQARNWNRDVPKWSVQQIALAWKKHSKAAPARIAVLGIAFKGRPATDDLRGTMALPLLEELRAMFPDADYVGFDPVVHPQALATLGITSVASLPEAFAGTDIAVIQNNHEAFARLNPEKLGGQMAAPGLIYDFWNQVASGSYCDGKVIAFGLGENAHHLA